jgi:hypothetical protein
MEKEQRIRKKWQPKLEEVADEEEKKNWTTFLIEEDKKEIFIKLMETNVWIHKINIAIELAIEENHKKIDKMDKELILEEYHNYLDIFNKEKAHWFFESRPWDHKIEIKEGFEPKSFKSTTSPQQNKSN